MAKVYIMKNLIHPRFIKSVIFQSKSQEGTRIAMTFLEKVFTQEYFTALKINTPISTQQILCEKASCQINYMVTFM